MVLDRFLGSRLNHADPKIRLGAVTKLASTDPLLAASAHTDTDPEVRRAALERLIDLEALAHAAVNDDAEANRQCASERLRSLLAGPETEAPGVELRAAFLAAQPEPFAADYLLEHAQSSQVRAAALKHVADEALLCRVAIHDSAAELRHSALERVHSTVALEEIEQATRSRDQGISRAARARLHALREAAKLHDEAAALCTRMEELAAGSGGPVEEAAFHHLEQEWKAHQLGAADQALAARYARGREAFRALLALRAQGRQARLPIVAQREGMLAELQAAVELEPGLNERAAVLLRQTQLEWDAAGSADAPDTQRFDKLGTEIEAQRARLQRIHTQAQPLRELVAHLRALAAGDRRVAAAVVTKLEERARSVRRPEQEALAHELERELADTLERLRQKQRREHDQGAARVAELEALVSEIEQALGRGEVGPALAKHADAQQRLQGFDETARGVRALRRRLQRVAPKLAELRDWQRWGVEQTRESLCVEAESLLGSAEPPEQLGRKIRAFRRDWQQLDRASGTTSKALWERFDRACTAAYAPVAAYFAEQRGARASNLQHKQAIIERLTALVADTDTTDGDWRAAERAFNACEREWRSLGPVDRSVAKSLAIRHGELRKTLDQRFAPRRESEIARRKEVIAQLQALALSDEVADAVTRVKEAQAQWAPAVSARRSVEQALWNEFRAACDAVFERVRAVRNAAAQEQRAAAQAGAAVCERIEALARELAVAGEETAAALAASTESGRAALAQLKREYEQAPRAARGEEAALTSRFKSASTAVQRALAARKEALGRLELQSCAARAQLCQQLEHALLADANDGAEAALQAAHAAWSDLPPLSGGVAAAVEQRFALACQAAQSAEARATLARTLAMQTREKQQLCLRMEILAGAPSPPAHEAARLAYRAQWMQESMRGISHWPSAQREKLEEARRIEGRWHALGAVPRAEDEALEARYAAAMQALLQSRGALV